MTDDIAHPYIKIDKSALVIANMSKIRKNAH